MLVKNNFNSINEAVKILNEGIVDVWFIKVSTGQIRRMHCTLEDGTIPQGYSDTRESIIANSFSSGAESKPFVVWDILMGGWRSFYLSNVVGVTPSLPFGDTKAVMEDMVDNYEDKEGIISPIDRQKMLEELTRNMEEKFSNMIEKTPGLLVDFSASKIKSWASALFADIIRGTKKKRSPFNL